MAAWWPVLALALYGVAAGADTRVEPEAPLTDAPGTPIYRGWVVFQHYCATCHGVNADGKGRAARLYDPRPADLRLSPYNNAYKELIIRDGGERVGRSRFMPPWGGELTGEQIRDVIAFLSAINIGTREQRD